MADVDLNSVVLPVAESFVSINGEGRKSGQLALFFRFKGCNLNCSYCDTRWANKTDTPFVAMTIADICNEVNKSNIANVTLTGGEPLFQDGMTDLIAALLAETNCDIEIETNGSVSIEKWRNHNSRLSFTMDYKLPESGMENKMNVDNFKYLLPNDTVKFVCSSIEDMKKAKDVIELNNLCRKCAVYLSPVFGKINPADMVEYMKANYMNEVRLQLQMHKFIWDPMERGV